MLRNVGLFFQKNKRNEIENLDIWWINKQKEKIMNIVSV